MTYSEVFKHLGHYLVSGGVTNSSLTIVVPVDRFATKIMFEQ